MEALVPVLLAAVHKGNIVVLGGIHMSEISGAAYRLLWGERTVRSVANRTRQDAEGFLELTGHAPIRTETVPFALRDATVRLTSFAPASRQVPPCWFRTRHDKRCRAWLLGSAGTGGLIFQCANSVGTVMCRAIWRVAPPKTSSRMREWP